MSKRGLIAFVGIMVLPCVLLAARAAPLGVFLLALVVFIVGCQVLVAWASNKEGRSSDAL